MQSTRLYWSTELNYEKVASIMTINQSETIKNLYTIMITSVAQKIVAIDFAKFDLLLIT